MNEHPNKTTNQMDQKKRKNYRPAKVNVQYRKAVARRQVEEMMEERRFKASIQDVFSD